MARPLFTTEIASAVLNVPLGAFNFVFPSLVAPCRSSRKMVTTRRISSSAGLLCRKLHHLFKAFHAAAYNVYLFVNRYPAKGRITVLKRRFKALDRSLTPLSRLFAVAMILKPRIACTSLFNSGTGSVFLRKNRDQSILHVRADTCQLFDTSYLTFLHSLHNWGLHQCTFTGSFCQ